MSVESIEYTSWEGQKSSRLRRIYAIVKKIFRDKLSSKGILLLLIIGMMITHVLPIIGSSFTPHEALTSEMMVKKIPGMEGYLTGGLFILFSLLFASVVCSDLISRDLQDNSFVLYFSRPIKTEDYLLGKIGGAFTVISVFCFLPPIAFSLAVIATQTGGNYIGSLGVLGVTVVVGIFTTFIFTSFGVMISSLTKKTSYAGVGAFASFFVLGVVGGIFSEFDPNWQVIDPFNLLNYSYNLIYGFDLPSEVSPILFGFALLSILVIPITVLYYRVYRRSAGK